MAITLERDEGLARLTMDDGKANAFDVAFFEELNAAMDECADAEAIVLAGRDGMFSGGLNLKAMQAMDQRQLLDLLMLFGRTMHRVWLEPRPVVGAATGHAVAGGTILSMACDQTVAARGEFRWGLNEVAIGLAFPSWILAIVRGNVPNERIDTLLLSGVLVDPETAVHAGFADELAEPGHVLAAAEAKARSLAALPIQAYADTKRRLRADASAAALAMMEGELRVVLGMA